MAKKKPLPYAIAALAALVIGLGFGLPLSHTAGGKTAEGDGLSREETVESALGEALVLTIKRYENVEDAALDTGTTPPQVVVQVKPSGSLTPEAREKIGKLVSDVYPNATVEYSYSERDH